MESETPSTACQSPIRWGSATYFSLSEGESVVFNDHSVKLHRVRNHICHISVEGETDTLSTARQCTPHTIGSLRIFISDTKAVATMTTDINFPENHGFCQKDAVICLSDSSKPLLDPRDFAFPIDRSNGYTWSMEEDSHMFAYQSEIRSHEGIDFDLTGSRTTEDLAVQAIENCSVEWISPGAPPQACILLKSSSQENIYYVYQHFDRDRVLVKTNQQVQRGQTLGHIYGDNRWEHLHFSVIACDTPPSFSNRYQNVINSFPQCYELWHGNLENPKKRITRARLHFADPYWLDGNRQRLNAYTPALGYGWDLGDWCVMGKVECVSDPKNGLEKRSALLRKTMYPKSPYPATNPENHFEFAIDVENGCYRVRAQCGNGYVATRQGISFQGSATHTLETKVDQWLWTPENEVVVSDNRLLLRVVLAESDSWASLKSFEFEKI